MSLDETLCADCGVDTLPVDARRAEWYMVENDVWRAAGMTDEPGSMEEFLCIGCIEIRLGRKLTPADFIDCPINDLSISETWRAWSYRTPRLIDRLGGTVE